MTNSDRNSMLFMYDGVPTEIVFEKYHQHFIQGWGVSSSSVVRPIFEKRYIGDKAANWLKEREEADAELLKLIGEYDNDFLERLSFRPTIDTWVSIHDCWLESVIVEEWVYDELLYTKLPIVETGKNVALVMGTTVVDRTPSYLRMV